ncbi:MAG: hypothetical protein KGI13_08270 [Betaproteobacteria bacterium]|nr:hypothetical protein [Betaproteobacteria bacterium]
MTSNSLTTVVCSYVISPEDIAKLLSDYGRRLGVYFHGVIIVNGRHELTGVGAAWTVKRGSNKEFEFSAYQEGLEVLGLTGENGPSVVLFINDTAFQKHHCLDVVRSLMPYRGPVADCVVPAMAGKGDLYDNICYRNPWSGLPVYLSTFCFLLNRLALSVFTGILAYGNADLGNNTIDLEDPAWGHQLETTFRVYLLCHLNYPGISNTWYQLIEKRNNRSLINQKARCVYYEHRLSGDIGANGVLFNIYPTPRKKWQFFLREQQAKISRRIFSLWRFHRHEP